METGTESNEAERTTLRRITLITTGGTIEKTYDELTGELSNRHTVVRRMLGELRLEGAEVTILELLHKDSLHLTEQDRERILEAVRLACGERDDPAASGETSGIVILHGTDTLQLTGELLVGALTPRVPIVLTAAWRPFVMKQSDALQNLTEALFATGVLAPGVYCVAHGRALPFPGVRKEPERRAFVHDRLPD